MDTFLFGNNYYYVHIIYRGVYMSIIARRNNLENPITFLNNANDSTYIDGILLEVTMTKDGIIVIYNSTDNLGVTLDRIQNSNFEDLDKTSVESLDTILQLLDGWKKKIIIRVSSLLSPILSDQTLLEYQEKNSSYIDKINKIIIKYPTLNTNLHSTNTHLIFYLKQIVKSSPIGLELIDENDSYVDVNYYIFPTTLLDYGVIKQQLDLNKDVMVTIKASDDLVLLYNFFDRYPTLLDIKYNIQFITSYPKLVNELIDSIRSKRRLY